MTVDIAFLDCPKNTPLREFSGSFGQPRQAANILETLDDVGIETYGQLLDYAKNNDFSDLPGIGAHHAERIRRFIEFMEQRNKGELKSLFLRAYESFPNMRGIAQQHIRERKRENDVLRNYS